MSQRFQVWVLALAALGAAMPAAAQDKGGARITGSFGPVLGEGNTNVAISGSAGYRFTPHFGVDFEVLGLPDFAVDLTRDIKTEGRGLAFLTNLVTELPGGASWLTPYIQGGGGVASVSQRLDLAFFDRDGRNDRFPAPRLRGFLGDATRGQILRPAETRLALSVGGGVDFKISRGLAAGPTISYMSLFGTLDSLDLTRIGVRASYRF